METASARPEVLFAFLENKPLANLSSFFYRLNEPLSCLGPTITSRQCQPHLIKDRDGLDRKSPWAQEREANTVNHLPLP